MALQKNKTRAGFTATYHRIAYYMENDEGSCIIRVASYKDKATREANKDNWFDNTVYEFPLGENPLILTELDKQGNNPRKLIYYKLKTHPDFQGATDI